MIISDIWAQFKWLITAVIVLAIIAVVGLIAYGIFCKKTGRNMPEIPAPATTDKAAPVVD